MSTESTFSSTDLNKGTRLTTDILTVLTQICETLAQRLSAENLAVRLTASKLHQYKLILVQIFYLS